MDMNDMNPNAKGRTSSYKRHIRGKVKEDGPMNGLVTRTSRLVRTKGKARDGSTYTKESFVIDVALKDEDWNDISITGPNEEGNKVTEGHVIQKWVGAWLRRPKDNQHQWLVNIFEKTGTLEQLDKVRSHMAESMPNADIYVDTVVEEMLRRSLVGRKVNVDVGNTTKAGDGSPEKQYAVVFKFLKILGDVPDCLSGTPVIDKAMELYNERKEKFPAEDAAPEKAEEPKAAPKKERNPVADEDAKNLYGDMTLVILTMQKLIEEEEGSDKKAAKRMRDEGIMGGLIKHVVSTEHKISDERVDRAIKALNATGTLMFPRDDQWRFVEDKPTCSVDDAKTYLGGGK